MTGHRFHIIVYCPHPEVGVKGNRDCRPRLRWVSICLEGVSTVSVEQTARDFFAAWTTGQVANYLTPDAVVSGGVLPQPMPALEAFQIMTALNHALPDLRLEVQQVSVHGDQATVSVRISGTQTGALSLPMPGLPAIPATGKRVSFADKFIVTVTGDKVSSMHVDSPADGGIPAMLAQLGASAPSA